MIQRTELFFDMTQFFFKIWLEEFNPSFYHDSKILLLFFGKNQRIWLLWLTDLKLFFFWIFFQKKKKTQRIEPFFLTMTLKMFFFEVRMRLTELIFFFCKTTHRIDLFEYDFFFWHWTFFLNSTQRIEISNTTQRNNFFSLICLKE